MAVSVLDSIPTQVLALDLSSTSSGVAFYDKDGNLHAEVLQEPKSRKAPQRIKNMWDRIEWIIEYFEIKKIVVEEVPNMGFASTTKILFWLQGYIVINLFLYHPNVEIEYMFPSSWRSFVGIQKKNVKRKKQKQMDIDYANKTFNLELDINHNGDDDIADALGILSAYSKPKYAF